MDKTNNSKSKDNRRSFDSLLTIKLSVAALRMTSSYLLFCSFKENKASSAIEP
jgi:hypothetical protein